MEIAKDIFFYRGRSGEKIRPGAGSANVTVVRGDSLAMIDTGVRSGGAFRELQYRIVADNLNLNDVRWILHTHCHWDHLNADSEIIKRSGAPIGAGEADIPFIENGEKNFTGFIKDFGDLASEVFPYPMMVARFLVWLAWGKQPQLSVERALTDGDCIDIGRRIEVVSLPGHTRGHMGYFIHDAGVLILGDLIDFENSQGMDLNNPYSDYHSALQSLERAMGLNPEVIIPGHGEPTRGRREVRAVLEKALEGGRDYPRQIAGALEKHPVRLKELTYRLFPDIPFSMEAMTMMLTLTVLLSMERSGDVMRGTVAGHPAWMRKS